ncbi:MAG TPA: PspC domain-containing protein [Solirubrobacterales bacterium]|nr:PspC domain-containing protein [Solirubrobacterales bacterium]
MAEKKKDEQETEDQSPSTPGPRRLLRSSKERMLWGVAGGIGEYLRIDPTFVRLGFVVATFFGGFGLIAYLVMAVVVPEDDGTGHPREDRRPPTRALILLAIVLLIALPGPLFGWGHGWHHWWGFIGPLWIALIVFAVIVGIRTLRMTGRSTASPAERPRINPPRWLRRDRTTAAEEGTSEDETAEAGTAETEVRDADPPKLVRLFVLIVLGVLAFCTAISIGAAAAWATATGHGSAVAGVVIALGVAIAATAFIGEARRVAPWLLASALVLALPAGATAAADIHFDGGIGERTYHPTTIADIPADGYDFGVGELQVDLRDLPWAKGQTIAVKSNLGVGQMIVSVPTNVCVHAHATGKAGELLVRGDQSDGIDPEVDQGLPRSQAPRLELDADIQLGQLIVTDQDPAAITEHGVDYDHNRLSKESQRQVCGL